MSMSRADIYNGGANARAAFGDSVTATAGGAGDNTEANGDWADRKDASDGIAMSVKCLITVEATLGAGASITFLANLQDAVDASGTGAADYGTPLTVTTVASSTPGETKGTVVELDFNLSSAREFIRLQFTPNLSAANTDTARMTVTYLFFGAQRGPATNSLI